MRFIDLRSDTVTMPTDEMREAMAKAPVGDSIFRDDPTVNKLEELAAAKVGKEDAIFLPSGTFGNQLALFTHCLRGQEIIIGKGYHIVTHEVGAPAVIAGVQLRTIDSPNGVIKAKDIEKRIRFENEDIHFPSTSLICIENAHSSGNVLTLSEMEEVYNVAKKYNLPVHLDGARIFNAATSLNVDVKELTKYCDSVMFCLSKGLCAPVGSIVAGSKEFIDKARKKRKLLGGGLRQAGYLAAAGIVALEKMSTRLSEDHHNAKLLAEELNKIPEVEVDFENLKINMVFFKFTSTNIETKTLVKYFLENNIKINDMENGVMRFVTHYWVKKEDVLTVVNKLKEFLNA